MLLKILGDSVDLVGKTDRQIKEAVITKTNSNFKGDGKSDDYINAYFDSMTAMATEKDSLLVLFSTTLKTKIKKQKKISKNKK